METGRSRRRTAARSLLDNTVSSPCIGVCWLNDETSLCEGCLRTGEEIRDWIMMTREQKLQLLQLLEQRSRDGLS